MPLVWRHREALLEVMMVPPTAMGKEKSATILLRETPGCSVPKAVWHLRPEGPRDADQGSVPSAGGGPRELDIRSGRPEERQVQQGLPSAPEGISRPSARDAPCRRARSRAPSSYEGDGLGVPGSAGQSPARRVQRPAWDSRRQRPTADHPHSFGLQTPVLGELLAGLHPGSAHCQCTVPLVGWEAMAQPPRHLHLEARPPGRPSAC